MKKVSLDEIISQLQSGSRPKNMIIDRDGIPSLGGEHLNNEGGFKFSNTKYISEEYFKSLKNGIIKEDDILIVKDGATTGKVSFVSEKFPFKNATLNEHVFRIGIDIQKAFPKYVFYYLFSRLGQNEILKDHRGATIGGISRNFTKKVKIPLPPLPEQKRIAAILDKADALRQKNKQLLAAYDELLQSVFVDMFGDPGLNPEKFEIIEFGSIIKNGPTNGIYKPQSDYGKGTYILRIDSFNNGDLTVIDDIRRVTATEKEKKTYSLNINDILINRVNSKSHLGKVTFIKALSEEAIFESNMMRIRTDNRVANPMFILKILSHPYIKVQILNRAKDAVNQSSINQQDVKSFTFYLPPIKLQNKFAQIVENIELQKALVKQSLQESEDLFNGLVQKAFKGKLADRKINL